MKEQSNIETPLCAENERTDKTFFFDGVPMAEAHLWFPVFAGQGSEKLNAFYGGLKDGCLGYVENTLAGIAKERYLADDSPRRRFLFRRLVFAHRTRIFRPTGFVSLCRETTVLYRGRVIFRREIGEVWDETGTLCTKDRFPGTRKREKKAPVGSFYLETDGRVILLSAKDL